MYRPPRICSWSSVRRTMMRSLSGRIVVANHRPVNRRAGVIQKSAVANQFGIQSAVVRMIDFLGHQAVELRADFSGGAACVNGERRSRGEATNDRRRVEQECDEFFHGLGFVSSSNRWLQFTPSEGEGQGGKSRTAFQNRGSFCGVPDLLFPLGSPVGGGA